MSVATLVKSVDIYTAENIKYKEFTSPVVAPTGVDMVEVDLGFPGGKLIQFKASGASTKFDVSLFDRLNGLPVPADYNTNHEFYRVTSVNKVWDDILLANFWYNADVPLSNKIYLFISNLDAVNAITPSFTMVFQSQINAPMVWHNL